MKNIMPIQVLNKKLYLCSLFTILCVALPLNGMFTQKNIVRLKRMQEKTAQKRPFGLSQRPMNINIQPTTPQSTEIKQPSFFSWFSKMANNWWYGPPLEEKLSTWSTNVGTTIKTTATSLSADIQSQQIINRLRKDQFVSNSSSETIQAFLENNRSDDIKAVFYETIKYLAGDDKLIKMCANNPSIAIKILPVIQEALTNPKIITTPTSKIPYESQNILRLTSKVLLQLSNNTNSAPTYTINEIKAQLLQILTAHPFYVIYIDIAVLLTILPDNIDDFITIIKRWASQIKFDVSGSDEMAHQHIQSFSYTISELLLQKIINEKNEKNKEKLCTIFLENEYASGKIEKIAPDDIDTISAIISAFKKKLVTNDIYKENFNLLTEQILNLTVKTKPLLVKDLTSTIISVLKEKLLTNNVYENNFCLLTIDVLRFAYYTNHPLAEDLTNAIVAQTKKASKSQAGLNLLTKILSPWEILQTILNINNSYTNTPSYRHLEKYASNIINAFPFIFGDPNFIIMIQNTLKKEKELNDLGYETFYNARMWKYNFLSDIYTMLYEYKSGTKLNNFIFTHFDDFINVLGKIHPRFFESEKAKHELLLEKGNIPDIAGYETLLFLNKFLFGNVTNDDPGRCSMYFLLSNTNYTPKKNLSIQEIFAMFGDFKIYDMYKEKLQNLQREHDALSHYGELLTIAIPKNKINQSVYHSPGFGHKEPFITQDLNIISNAADILKSLNQNPDDNGSEFAMPNTKLVGPKSGIELFSFNTVDPVAMKAFKAKEHALFAEIVQAMKKEDSKKEMEARSRE